MEKGEVMAEIICVMMMTMMMMLKMILMRGDDEDKTFLDLTSTGLQDKLLPIIVQPET